ncbi:MAG TPA: hypothetical protein VGP72_22760 [Planctomycetota bacterium]|jgi:predicted Fe-Mo cluster-binding NifX family protein
MRFPKAAVLAISFTVLFSVPAFVRAAEEPAKVTTFELSDGTNVKGLHYAVLGSAEYRTYIVDSIYGKTLTLVGRDVCSVHAEMVPLNELPKAAQQDVLNARAIAKLARAKLEAAAREERALAEPNAKVKALQAELQNAERDVVLARQVLSGAEQILKNAKIEIVRADAKYDAAKTELASGGASSIQRVGYGYGYGYGGYVRADKLRDQMMDAAEQKVKVEEDKTQAQAVVARTNESLPRLQERVEALRKDLDAARGALDKAREEIHKAEQQRAEEEITIKPTAKM